MRWRRAALALIAVGGLAACSSPGPAVPPMTTVANVDLARYAGRWYEVARYPNRFQAQCASDVTATYALNPDGTVAVTNACRRADGSTDVAEGVARIADPATKAQLEVRFAPAALSWLPVVWGDYWVLALDPAYRYALVGEPSREYLWVLSRTPSLAAADEAALMDAARRAGYDPLRLVRTPHQGAAPR